MKKNDIKVISIINIRELSQLQKAVTEKVAKIINLECNNSLRK